MSISGGKDALSLNHFATWFQRNRRIRHIVSDEDLGQAPEISLAAMRLIGWQPQVRLREVLKTCYEDVKSRLGRRKDVRNSTFHYPCVKIILEALSLSGAKNLGGGVNSFG
jgi:hypothetical protein